MGDAQAQGMPEGGEHRGSRGDRSERYLPPEPVGTPFKGDPAEPFPFEVEAPPGRPSQPPPFPYGDPPVSAPPPSGQPGPPPGPPPGFGRAPHEPPLMMPPEFTQQRMRHGNSDIPRRNARTALIVSVVSLFIFGIVLGPIGIVLGVRSIRQGEKSLGWWAVAVGAVGFIASLALFILFATGTIENPFESLGTNKDAK